MNNRLYYILSLFIFFGCASAERLLYQEKYEAALRKAEKKMRKKPEKLEYADIYTQAYNAIFYIDSVKVHNLRLSEDDSHWKTIHSIYSKLNRLQVKAIMYKRKNWIDIPVRNYDNLIKKSRNKAVEYAYNQGVKFLRKGDRVSARVAYDKFIECRNLKSNFLDVDKKIDTAAALGVTNVFLVVQPNKELVMSEDFYRRLSEIDIANLNTLWVNFEQIIDANKSYPYSVKLEMISIQNFPERISQREYTAKNKVVSGKKFLLDENGKIKKDKKGKEMKEDRYIQVQCHVTEFVQLKKTVLQSKIYIHNNENNTDVLIKPLTSEAVFRNIYLIVNGDRRALNKEQTLHLRNKSLLFPSNKSMILDCASILKTDTKRFLSSNIHLFR